MKTELVTQRQNLALLEQTFSEKIDALFVVRQVHIEKIEDHDIKIKSINRLLDYHHSEILYLKSRLT